MRQRIHALFATSVVLLLAGCATAVTGTPAANPRFPEPTSELSPVQMCGLLSDARREELSLMVLGEPRVNTVDDPECEWRTAPVRVVMSYAANGFSIDQVPIAPGDQVRSVDLDGHRARVFVNDDDPNAGCSVYVELTPTSYLEASTLALTAGQGLVDECGLARTVARYALENFPR